MKKSIIKNLSLTLILCLLLTCTVCLFVGCDNTPKDDKTFVAIDINPAIELILDGNNKVVSVSAKNEDAQIMLYGATGIINVSVEDASKKIAELAVQYNYITNANGTINVTVSGKTTVSENELFAKIDASFTNIFTKENITASLAQARDIVLEKQLEALKSKYPSNSAVQALTVQKLRLINSAMLADLTLKFEDAVALSNAELSQIVETSHQYYKDKLTKACEVAYEQALLTYTNAKETLIDGVYIAIKPASLADLSVNFKAIEYTATRSAYRTIKQLYDIGMKMAREPELNQTQIQTIATKLSIPAGEKYTQFVAEITDSEGDVTSASVEYYLNQHYRNMTDAEKASYEKLVVEVETAIQSVKSELIQVSASVTSAIGSAISTLGIKIEVKTYNDIPSLLNAIKAKSETLEKWFADNLTQEQKDFVKTEQDKLATKFTQLEESFNAAVNEAKKTAETYIANLQKARKA